MSEPQLSFDVFGISDVGKKRSQNEDHFLVASLGKTMALRFTNLENVRALEDLRAAEAHFLVVADGVGGVSGGRLASGTAVDALTQYIGHAMDCYYNFDVDLEQDFIDALEGAVRKAHERVVAEYASHGGQGPATTLTMVTLIWPRAYVIHVGDSRGYFLRGGRLKQFTRDQTMGEALVDAGALTEEQARQGGLDQVLASAIGGSEMAPSIGLLDLRLEDWLLLCTDGITKHVADADIARILERSASAKAAGTALLQAALDGGGSDNITVIVSRMRRTA